MATFTDHTGKTAASRVAVVAAGVISPLGHGLGPTKSALERGQDGVSAVSSFPTEHFGCKPAGQIPDDWLGRGDGRLGKRLHRASRMMIKALGEVFEQDRHFF